MILLYAVLYFAPISLLSIILFRLFYVCSIPFLMESISVFSLVLAVYVAKKHAANKWLVRKALIPFVFSVLGFMIFLASLNCARCDDGRAVIKQSLGSVRVYAGLYQKENNSSYAGLCKDTIVTELSKGAESAAARASRECYGPLLRMMIADNSETKYLSCNSSIDEYVIEVNFKNGEEYLCVDTEGSYYDNTNLDSIGNLLRCN